MKRLCVVLVILAIVSGAVYAAGPYFGARLGVGIGFHGHGKDMDDAINGIKTGNISIPIPGFVPGSVPISVDEKSGVAFALSPYGGYYFTDKLAIQGEFNFMFGQKKTWEMSSGGFSGKITGKYSSLDIPILAKYDLIATPVLFGALAGPYLSIPLGDIEVSAPSGLAPYLPSTGNPDGITAGIALGVYGGYPIGPGRIVGDVRFIMDFNALKMKNSDVKEVIKRRGLNITAGYEMSLGGKK
jgi:hypothetical protein